MRFFRWITRRGRGGGGEETPGLGGCRYCGALLTPCPGCRGAWRGRDCGCGIGALCPTHQRRWC